MKINNQESCCDSCSRSDRCLIAYNLENMQLVRYPSIHLGVSVTSCDDWNQDSSFNKFSRELSREEVIEKLKENQPEEKGLDVIPASKDNKCNECGARGTELIKCSLCGRLICPDCMYDDPYDDSKAYCGSCYDKLNPLRL